MMSKKFVQLLAVFVIANLLISCGGLSSKQRSAAEEALKSVRKIDAATQVSVNYQQYGSWVIDAQSQLLK